MIFKIHKEGIRIIIVAALVTGIAIILLLNVQSIIGLPIVALLGLVFLWILSFFRNPVRNIAQENANIIYAPADGKVVVIEKTFDSEFIKAECIQVSIFMSPMNVHVNRVPVGGKVVYSKHHPGKYLVAWHPKSSIENERHTNVIHTQHGNILIRQIAGAMARRIISYLQPGTDVNQGQDLGFIRFGSRVDILLPLSYEIAVSLGDRVRGNQTILARIKNESSS